MEGQNHINRDSHDRGDILPNDGTPEILSDLYTQGVRVLDQGSRELGCDINYEAYDLGDPGQAENFQNEFRQAVETILRFLSGVIFVDSFPDHHKRVAWRGDMCKKYPDFHTFYNSNKLRRNKLNSVEGAFRSIDATLRFYKAQGNNNMEKIQALRSQLPTLIGYDNLAIEQKLEVVKKYEEIAKEFLELVSK